MPEEKITTKFEFDGKSLLAGLDKTAAALKQSEAEFNAATAGMDRWSESSDGLNEKLKLLNIQLEDSKRRQEIYDKALKEAQKASAKSSEELARLRDQYENLDPAVDKNSEAFKKLKADLNEMEKIHAKNEKSVEKMRLEYTKQTAETKKTEQSIKHYTSSLEEVSEAEKAAAKSGKSVSAELKKIRDNAEEADDSIEDLEGGFTVLKGAMASLLADGIKSVISGFFGLAESTREHRTELAKLQTISDEMGASFDQTKDAYKDLIATTGDEGAATEALNNLLSAGYADNQLDEITRLVEGTAIKWKDTLKAEGLADSIQEWIGSDGASLTGNFAEALERMGYDLESVTEKTKGFSDEQRRQWVINTLTKEGLGAVSDAYREQNKDLIEASNAQFAWNDQMAKVGAIAEPVITAVKQGFADLLGSILEMTGIDLTGFADGITKAFSFLTSGDTGGLMEAGANMLKKLGEGITNNLPEFISKALDAVSGFSEKLRENAPIVIEGGINFIRNLVRGLMDSLPELISKVPEIISNFANVINDNAPTIIMAGVGIIKDIVVGIIKAIPTLVKNIPKIITAIVDVWEAFNWVQLGKNVLTKLGDGIKSMKSFVKTKMSEANTALIDAIKGLPQTLLNLGKSAMTDLGGAIKGAKNSVTTAAKTIFNAVWNTIKSLPDKMLGIGKDLVKGLWNGISNMTGWVIGKIQGFGESVLGGIKDFFGIKSPSVVMKKEVGRMLPAGMVEGIDAGLREVKSAMTNMGNVALNSAKSAVSGAQGTLSQLGGISGGVSSNNAPGGQNMASGKTIVFNQNITSPKALNRWEIARQTRNTLQLVRGV